MMTNCNIWSLVMILWNDRPIICEFWFIDDNKYTTSIKDGGNRENQVLGM